MSVAVAKSVKIPGPDHPITIEKNPNRVVVTFAERVIADTRQALTLREAGYAAVQYIPRSDVDMSGLVPSQHETYCPFKGDCSYYSVVVGDRRAENAVWTYEAPYPAVAEIAGHLAFYPNRVDSIEEQPSTPQT
jgi:uncharacterized protein (DUF427 family)